MNRKHKKNPKVADKECVETREVRRDSKRKDYRNAANDPSWYTRNARLTADAGSIAFTWPLGAPITLDPTYHFGSFSVPGVCAFGVCPAMGYSSDNTSVINVAAKRMYSFIRHANSGHANYDAPNLMMYLLAMDSVYSWWALGVRAYGVLSLYSQRNRYYPRVVTDACGFDFDSLFANLADFRYYLNQLAIKIGSLCIPNVWTYFTRHIWMYSSVFMDSPSLKSQLYVYVPEGFHYYDTTTEPFQLSYDTGPISIGLDEYKEVMDKMLNPILGSEDFNIMSGDILKAYGENNLVKLSQISENYTVTPLFSEEVLEQIQNITIVNGTVNSEDFKVTEDVNTGALVFKPAIRREAISTFPAASNYTFLCDENRILSALQEDPVPERVLTGSRLAVGTSSRIVNNSGTTEVWSDIVSVGSEFIRYARIFYINSGGAPAYVSVPGIIHHGSNTDEVLDVLAKVSNFAHFPTVVCARWSSSSDVVTAHTYRDLENYAIVGRHELDKMHEAALLSMFDVPQMGTAFGT